MLHQYIQPLVTYLHAHPHAGGFIAYFIAFIESIAVLGTIVPGSITMTAIGVLVGTGILPAVPTILWAIAGAYTGDCLSYWAGIYYKDKLRRMWPFNKYGHWLATGEKFFKKHGGKSIVIGRFTGPVRSLVPMIAGLLRMPPLRFLPVALISAILWALIYMLPGIIIGALSLELPPAIATKFILLCLVIIACLWGITWLIKYFFDQVWNQIDRGLIKIWNYLNVHKSSHWFTQMLRNPANKESHQQLVRAVFVILNLFLFLWIFASVISKSGITRFNLPFYNLLQSAHLKIIDNFMLAMTSLGDKHVLLIVAGIVLIFLLWIRRWWAALHLFVLTLVSIGSIQTIKNIVYSPRPAIIIASDPTSSFLSGHVLLSVTLLGFFAVLIADNLPRERRSSPYLTTLTLVILIALSRVYLGAHWLTDILGSLFLGLTLLLFIVLSYRRHSISKISAPVLTALIIFSVLIAWSGYSYFHFKTLKQQFTQVWPIKTTTLHQWWDQHPGQLPLYRNDRIGHPFQPINVQWLGDINAIEQTLISRGWESHTPKINLNDTLNRLMPAKTKQPLPLIPALYHNRTPVLLLTKSLGDDQPIVMLRLWQSDIIVDSGRTPLWLGTVSYYQPPTKLITLRNAQKNLLEFIEPNDALKPDLTDFIWRELIIPPQQAPVVQKIFWDGKVLLIR